MSAEQTLRALIAVGLLLAGAQAQALGIPDLLDDPLRTRPATLDEGARLPGDDAVPICPPAVDLNQPLALVDVVDVALCNNPQVKSAWAAIKAQAAGLGEARAAYLPTLTGTTSRLRSKTHYPDLPHSDTQSKGNTASANLSWRLFDFGTRAANHEAAQKLLTAALLGYDAALQKTLAGVVGAYFDAQTAQAAVEARSEAARLADETLAATLRRERKGAAAQSDTLQANVALSKARLAEQRAQGDDQKARAVLIYAMGLPSNTTLQLAPLPAPVPAEAVSDLARWLEETSERHPAILAARAQSEAASAKVDAARGEGLPSIDFTGNFYRNGFPNQGLQSRKSDTTTWGLALNIPLFEGFSRTYKIRGAQAQAEQSAANLAEVERQILAEVVKAHADAQASLANLDSSSTLLEAAQASLASSQKRYAMGAADILELLTVQSALADAQQERVRCLAEWRSARLRLMANAGMMARHAAE
jgi:outer membrane protein